MMQLKAPGGFFGQTFPLELIAEGFDITTQLPFYFTTDAIVVNDGVDSVVLSKLQQLVAAHDNTKLPPPPVPPIIPLYKAKIVLALTKMPNDQNTTILDAANAFIASIADDTQRLIATTAFNSAPELYRDSETLATVIENLNLPEELVDQMFIQANALKI